MRPVRPIFSMLVVSAVLIGCSAPAGSGQQSEQGSGASANASQPDASQSAESTGGGGGGGANGSVHYDITGGYAKSGDLSWQPLASTFSNGAWYMFFRENGGDNRLAINGATGTFIVLFGNTEIEVAGGVEPACTFNFTRQDANGAAGSFNCHGLLGGKSDGTSVMVDFKGDFDGHK